MKQYFFLILFLFFTTFFGQGNFVEVSTNLPYLKDAIASFGDFDNDGDLDLYFTGNEYFASLHLIGGLYENVNGNFILVSNSGLPLLYLGYAEWGDFDNDNDLDLIIMGHKYSYDLTDIYINNGDGTFSPLNSGIYSGYNGEIHFVDLNNDGHLDVGIKGFNDEHSFSFSKLYLNNGNNTLTEINNTSFPQSFVGKIRFVDYDNDGYQDIVFQGYNNDNFLGIAYTKIWKNEHNNTFVEQDLNLPQLAEGNIEFGDLDNDGDLDILVSGYDDNGVNSFHLLKNINNSYTERNHFILFQQNNVRIKNFKLADFDQDGFLDIFLTGTSGYDSTMAKLFFNNGSLVFHETLNPFFDGASGTCLAACDYDNDGKTDIFYTGIRDGYILRELYHNGPLVKVEKNVLPNNFKIICTNNKQIIIINTDKLNFIVNVFDLNGKLIYNSKLINYKSYKIDLSHIPQQMLIIQIKHKSNIYTQKVLLK